MDPRKEIIKKRLEGKKIVAVSGAKGGIGKSMVSCSSALALSSMGYRVGLLDLDFSSPSDHTILGAKHVLPEEKNGVVPPEVCGIKFMSIFYYTGNKPSPFRGIDISNAIKEMLAITIWKDVDLIVVDMPPGMGEEFLDFLELADNVEFLAVTTPSRVSVQTVKKFVSLVEELEAGFLGVLENMKINYSSREHFRENFLGSIRFDLELEDTIGNPTEFMKTQFSRELREILKKIF